MQIKTLLASSKSYNQTKKRKLSSIQYIVIHYTGNTGDTAVNNVKYFNKGNTRAAGAHFFVDKKGEVYRSIYMNRIAWSVGGFYTNLSGASKYYRKCTNNNSVSIELCDLTSSPSSEQIKSTKQLIKYIQKKCPNAKTIIRHWDVNGKTCPAPMCGKNNKIWKTFLAEIKG